MPLDIKTLRSHFDDSDEILITVLEAVSESLPENIENLVSAKSERDFQKLRFVAHTLKGALGNILAMEASELAALIDHDIKSGNLAQVVANTEALIKISGQIVEIARSYLETAGTAA